MPIKITSFAASFESAIREKLADNLTDAIIFLNEEIKDKIGVQGPPRSTPGNPPHMDTRALRDSIRHVDAAPDTLVAASTSDTVYAVPLEVSYDRPYWVSTLLENADEIAQRVLKP